MILKIAWRNIWRNKLRSLVVMISIALGLWAGIFGTSLANGLNKQRVDSVVENQLSHFQIHNPSFKENFDVAATIENPNAVIEKLQSRSDVKAVSSRTIVNGMVSSSATSQGVQIKGIVPEQEAAVIDLSNFLVEGEYFGSKSRTPSILLGTTLAEKLNVSVRKKLVLKFQDKDTEVVAAAFKVVGLYRTNDTRNDEMSVYVEQKDLNRILNVPDAAHEIAVLLNDIEVMEEITPALKASFPNLLVENWKQLFPGLDSANEIAKSTNMLLLIIIMLALCFGILNTMLMVVLERVREFGMLMAVGLNKIKVFIMIMLETIILMLTATPVGLGLAWLTVYYFSKNGIDFSAQSEGFSSMGIDPIVYPYLSYDYYPKVILLVVAAAILSAIYPAIKAIRLNPAESIRKL